MSATAKLEFDRMLNSIPTSAIAFEPSTFGRFQLSERLSWHDPDTGCTLVLSQPDVDPELWAEFSLGAQLSYRKHGVECALDIDALRSGSDTIMFFAIIPPMLDIKHIGARAFRQKAPRTDD